MTQTIRIRSGTNVMVSSLRSNYAYGGPTRTVLSVTSGVGYTFIRFPLLPGSTLPKKAAVTGARLRLSQVGDWPTLAGRTLTATTVQGPWSARTTYDTQPPVVAGSGVPVLDTVSSDLDYWTFDVSNSVAAIFAGTSNWGWRIETTDAVRRNLRAFDSAKGKPYLEIDYVVPPDAPTDLNPSTAAVSLAAPVLGATATRDMTGYQIQVDPAANATDPLYDTGEVLGSAIHHNLATFTSTRTANITRTLSSTTVTAPTGTFARADVGASISVTGIPAGATITAVASSTSATISAAATTAGTATTTIVRSYGAGLANNASTQWRTRVENEAGWSPWSSWIGFSRVVKSAATLVSPTTTSTDNTPPTTWTFAGTQTAWRVSTFDSAGRLVDDSGKVNGAATSYTPVKPVKLAGASYTTEVRLFDNVVRDSTPGDPAYTLLSTTWTFNYSATPVAVTSLTATSPGAAPWVNLVFVRATLPDAWVIERDGVIIATLRFDDPLVTVSGTTYTWVDWTAAPNRSHAYRVRPKVNNQVASTGPTATIVPTIQGVWIGDPDNNKDVCIVGNDDPDASYGEDTETYTPLGRPSVVNVNVSKRGLEGTATGALWSVLGRTVTTDIDTLYNIKERDSDLFRLVWADVNIPAVFSQVNPRPRRTGTVNGQINRVVSLAFAQDGELPFEPEF